MALKLASRHPSQEPSQVRGYSILQSLALPFPTTSSKDLPLTGILLLLDPLPATIDYTINKSLAQAAPDALSQDLRIWT